MRPAYLRVDAPGSATRAGRSPRRARLRRRRPTYPEARSSRRRARGPDAEAQGDRRGRRRRTRRPMHNMSANLHDLAPAATGEPRRAPPRNWLTRRVSTAQNTTPTHVPTEATPATRAPRRRPRDCKNKNTTRPRTATARSHRKGHATGPSAPSSDEHGIARRCGAPCRGRS